jgi:hypothetical protein
VKRSQLEEAITAATAIVRQDRVYIIGSQSILGTFDESQLPDAATFSIEVDIAPIEDDAAESLATLLDAQVGELSEFHLEHGFYIQGVGRRTANLPKGWQGRLVEVRPPGVRHGVGLCLDPHDLCAAKLLANREKDLGFVSSLLEAGLVDSATLSARVDLLDPKGVSGDRIAVAQNWAKWAEGQYPPSRPL